MPPRSPGARGTSEPVRLAGGGEFPRPSRERNPARYWKWTAIAALSILLLIAPMPILASQRMTDGFLVRLSNIGQAYGALAALFSALALGAVSFSVVYQRKQHDQMSIMAWRNRQDDLLRMVIDDSATFAPCVVDPGLFDDAEELRRYLFTTLWLSYARSGLHLELITAETFRDEFCKNLFASEVARKLWLRRRELTLAEYGFLDPFYQVMDTEYRKKMADLATAEAGAGQEA